MLWGLTGGIASGKSTVAAMLVNHGARLIDADQLAREAVWPGTPALASIATQFGSEVLQADGSLDRGELGRIVFADEAARRRLEAIVHPEVRKLMKLRMREAKEEAPMRPVVVDIPLLYESGLETWFREVIVVYVPREVQIARLMARDQLARHDAEERLSAQLDLEEKRQRADVVIDNSGTLEETSRQVTTFVRSRQWI